MALRQADWAAKVNIILRRPGEGRDDVNVSAARNYTDAVVTPPSTTMVCPVMKLDASEPR